MNAIKPETVEPIIAISSWKHDEFVKVQGAILRNMLADPDKIGAPGDVPEDLLPKESRNGVCSNAWNVLRALKLIERVPLGFTNEERGIIGGRRRNPSPGAKGRWTAVYMLKSERLAKSWLRRNGQPVTEPEPVKQLEMQL